MAETPCNTETPRTAVMPILHYDDTRAALLFLVDVLGFRAATTAADDEGDLAHAARASTGSPPGPGR